MSTKNAYRLINPYVEGSMDTTVRASNSFSAGKKLYNNISKFFTNHVENFYMTLQNLETKELSHFKIGEKAGNKGFVDYNLVKLDENFNQDLEKKLITNVEKLEKQSGGKRYYNDDDSPSESSTEDTDYFKYPLQPISKFVYFYLPYYRLNVVGVNPIDLNRLFVPTFSLPVNPSLEIRLDLYKYY